MPAIRITSLTPLRPTKKSASPGYVITLVIDESLYVTGLRLKDGVLLAPGNFAGRTFHAHVKFSPETTKAIYDAVDRTILESGADASLLSFEQACWPLLFDEDKDSLVFFGKTARERELENELTALKASLETA